MRKHAWIVGLIVAMIALWGLMAHADERSDAAAALDAARAAIAQAQAAMMRTQSLAPGTPVVVAQGPTVDLTGISVAVIGAVALIINTIGLALIQKNTRDKQSAEVLGNAIKNAVGAMQQAAEGAIINWGPSVALPHSIPPNLVTGVQYVMDHAEAEAKRFGVTPQKIAEKINAQIGLAEIQSNILTAASSEPTAKPLDPIVRKPA